MRRTGSGAARISVPAVVDGHAVRHVKVYLSCTPRGAAFEIDHAGARAFWGTCDAGSAVVGAFATGADRVVAVKVQPTVHWSLAITTSR